MPSKRVTLEKAIDAIRNASGPLTLNLSWNSIGVAGAALLAEAIKKASVPLILKLRYNNIGDAGTEPLAEAIKESQVPLTLDLRNNKIGDEGARLLAEAIREAFIPFSLDSSDNNIGNVGKQLLADAQNDNFIIAAKLNPLDFLSRIGDGLCNNMLMRAPKPLPMQTAIVRELQEFIPISVVGAIIYEYNMDDHTLACIVVAAIRKVEGASRKNKYSSIKYSLLNAEYSYIQHDGGQEGKEVNQSVAAGGNSSNVDSLEGGDGVSSSYNSGGNGDVIDSVELSGQQSTVFNISGNILHVSYKNQLCINHHEENVIESLLATLFVWIMDLSHALKHSILSSFGMQQVVEILEDTIRPDRFIINQLSGKPIEETFATEYQSYYRSDDFLSNDTQYARVNQLDHLAFASNAGEATFNFNM